jgi:hypothetical protein
MDLAAIGFKADTSGIDKASKGLDNLAKQGGKTERSLQSAGGGMAKTFAAIAGAVATVATAMTSLNKIVAVTREFDVLNAGLITATGSAENATQAFKAIQDFATSTPYSLAQATKAFNQLVNMGLTPSEKALTSYGNTAAAMGKDLSQMVEAVADAATGEFERLKEFGIKSSAQGDRVAFTFRGITTTVGNSAAEIESYLMALGNNEFAGAMANRMATLDGAISNLSDSWDALFLTISKQGAGGVIESSVRSATDAIQSLTDALASGQMQGYLDAIISKFTGFGAGVAGILDNIGGLFADAGKYWSLDMSETARLIVDAFRDMPENIKAFLQIVTIEVAAYVDRMVVYGKMAADALNPFGDGFDPAAQLTAINQARQTAIQSIMNERQASIDSFTSQITAADQLRKAYDENASAIDTNIDRLEQYGKTAASVGKIGAAAFRNMDEAAQDHFEALEDLSQIETDRIKRKEEEIESALEWEDATIKSVETVASISEKAAERIESAFADAWMNAFDGMNSVVDGMKNAFKRMLAEMAHMALTKPIMVSLGMGGMLPSAANAGGLGGLSSGLGLLGGLGGGLISAGGALGGAFGGGLAGAGGLLANGSFGAMFSGAGSLFGSGNIMAGLGMSMPIIAGAVVAAMGINKLAGGGLFGTSYKQTGQDLGLSLGGGDISGQITTEESRKKSLFRGTKRRTTTSDFDASSIDAAFDEITAAIGSAANAFGIAGADEIIKGFTTSVNINIKDKSEAEIQAAIEQWVSSTTDSLVSAVFGESLDGLQREGEDVIDTVNRLSANVGAVSEITKALGIGFDLTGKSAMVASTTIIDLAGGIDQLADLSSQYYQSFYTETERQVKLQQQLSQEFGSLNTEMPTTRDGFRALVDGLDLTKQEGQSTFAALMKLVPSMNQYLTAIEAQADATQRASEALKAQESSLQLRLTEALGKSTEALTMRRKAELEATDESLRALLEQVYAAEDAATANKALAEAQAAAAGSARESFAVLSDAISRAVAEQDASLESRLGAISSERDAINMLIEAQDQLSEKLRDAAQNAFGKLEQAARSEIKSADELLNTKLIAIDAERKASESASSAVQQGYSAQLDAAQQYADSMRSIAEMIGGFLAESAEVVNPFKRLTQLLSEARGGLLPSSEEVSSALSGIRSAGSAGFGSAFEQQRANAIARSQALQLQGLFSGAATQADAQTIAINNQSTIAQTYYAAQLSKLDTAAEDARKQHAETVGAINSQLEAAQKQLNALLGVDDRTLTMSQALSEFNSAMQAVSAQTIVSYDEQLSALDAQEALAISQHAESVALLKSQLATAQSQLNAMLGLDDRVLTVEQAMNEFISSLEGASSTVENKQVEAINKVEAAIVDLRQTLIGTGRPDDSIWLPPTMPEQTLSDAKADPEMKELLMNILAASKANADHSSKSASILQEMTIGGIDVRVEA